jgi:hypothetical protein
MPPSERWAKARRPRNFEIMQHPTTLAARFLLPFAAAGVHRSAPAPCRTPAPPLLVLRGVSQQGTIRSRAARVIAVTAMHFDAQGH